MSSAIHDKLSKQMPQDYALLTGRSDLQIAANGSKHLGCRSRSYPYALMSGLSDCWYSARNPNSVHRPHPSTLLSSASLYPILASLLHLATVDVSSTARILTHDWLGRMEDLLMNSFGAFLKRKFGGRTQRVSIDAGFTCPNVDGAVARGGCNFCDNRSFSPSRRVRLRQVSEQLQSGMNSVRERYDKVASFIAYFQPATNTYAPVEQLQEVFKLAMSLDEQVVGLAIGTRPDCVPESVLSMIERLASRNVRVGRIWNADHS